MSTLEETKRVMAKIANVVDGEDSLPTFYALIALAIHCSRSTGLADDMAIVKVISAYRKSESVR